MTGRSAYATVCYGRLLSLYEIKAGTAPDDEKAEDLVAALLSAVAAEDLRHAERLFRAAEKRAEHLTPESVRFIASAEHLAGHLQADPPLEWSGAVIGLCKAVEAEVVFRILRPLAARASRVDLGTDRSDKDLGRVAAYCADQTRKPPELGTFAHFLRTIIHSQHRYETSALLSCFLRLTAEWTGSHWLLDEKGFHSGLVRLTTSFRNRAAHIEELGKVDYVDCRELVIGFEGLLWKLLLATERHK